MKRIRRKTKKKQRKKEFVIDKRKKTKKESLVLEHNSKKTSVFLSEKLILEDSASKPFIYVIIGEVKKKGEKDSIQKKIPLRCATAEKTERGIELLFYNKGEQVKLLIKEIEKRIIIKIKKREYGEINLVFPRGTKEKINYIKGIKNEENRLFSTKTSNFFSSEGYLFNLKTAKEWDIKITNTEKKVMVKGEKAKINIFYGENEEEILKNYYGDQYDFKETKNQRQERYINVDKNNYKQRIEILTKKGVVFDGVILKIKIMEDGQKQKEITEYCKKKEKNILFKIKPYVKTKEKINNEYLVKAKEKTLFVQEIEGEKYNAIDLSSKQTRIWLKNKIREILDTGIKGFVAEKGKIDEQKTDLEQQPKYSYGEVWYILWQKLLKEVMEEYPQKILLLKDNGTTSYRYGTVVYEEFLLKKNDGKQIEEKIQDYRKCGMGNVAVELRKDVKKWSKTSKYLKKRAAFIKEMPFVLLPDAPEKVIIKILKQSHKTPQ